MEFLDKVLRILTAKSGVPGNGLMRVVELHDRDAEVVFATNIRPRSIDGAPIVHVSSRLQLPIPDKDGVFDIHGQNISLVRRARMRHPGTILKKISDLEVASTEETYAEIIANALAAAIAPVRRGTGEFDRLLFETKLAASFSSDEYARNLPAVYNRTAALMWRDTVVLSGVTLDEKNPIPEGWEKVFDLVTTPQSDKVCQVYTLAKGARVEKGKLIPGDGYFHPVVEAGVFAPACAPTQMYKPVTTLKNFVELLNPEYPAVCHEGVDRTLFQGRSLLTAIVHDEYNQMDQITISESAAKHFAGRVYMSEVVQVTSGGSELLVEEGDTVKPNQVLAKVTSIEGESEVRARRLIREAEVYKIESFRRIQNGIDGTQHRIVLRSVAPLVSGDKIMPRSGCKGCVVVVPDDRLPEIEVSPGQWQRADLAVNPFPVAKRKNLSMLLEMALNDKMEFEVPLDVTAAKLKELYEEGFGHKKPARRNGELLEEKVAAGHVFWMRNDSLYEYRTYVAGKVKKNFQELNPDRGRNSGISYNPTMRILLGHDKKCPTLDAALMIYNFNPKVGKLVKSLYGMLDTSMEEPEEEVVYAETERETVGGRAGPQGD